MPAAVDVILKESSYLWEQNQHERRFRIGGMTEKKSLLSAFEIMEDFISICRYVGDPVLRGISIFLSGLLSFLC